MKRVSEKVNKSSQLARKAFTTIAYHIPEAETPEDVMTLFSVLAGEKEVKAAATLIPESSVVRRYADEEEHESWKQASHWVDWWRRPRHLRKSPKSFHIPLTSITIYIAITTPVPHLVNIYIYHSTGMLCACCSDNKVFESLPETTNTVESHNRAAKGKSHHNYTNLTPDARAKRAKQANLARSLKRARNQKEETDGPPDKHQDLKKGMQVGFAK